MLEVAGAGDLTGRQFIPIRFNCHADELAAGADAAFQEESLECFFDLALVEFHHGRDLLVGFSFQQ